MRTAWPTRPSAFRIGLTERRVGVAQRGSELRPGLEIAFGELGQGRTAALLILRQIGFAHEQRRGQRGEGPGVVVAWAHDGDPPAIDRGDHPGRRQPRDEPGARERRLAAAARADEQKEGRAPFRRPAPQIDRVCDFAAAPEKDRRVLRAEDVESAERRALDLDRPARGAPAGDLVRQPLTQELFELRLELILFRVAVEIGLEIALRRAEPFGDEIRKRLPLALDLVVVRIVERRIGREPSKRKT